MALVTFANEGRRLVAADLSVLEKEVGCSLPEQYREFLLTHNGGRPSPDRFIVTGWGGERSDVQHFYSLGDAATSNDLIWNSRTFSGRLPSGLLPIACDSGGNQICISYDGSDAGFIYFWDHEAEHAPPSYKNVYRIEDSFKGFLDCLEDANFSWETEIDRAIREDDAERFSVLLQNVSDIEQEDQWGRTMLENAAIQNANQAIELLIHRGARLRNALSLAQENAQFFPEHSRAVEQLNRYKSRN